MSKYEFPKIPRAEIVDILSGSNIAHVSEADLLRPSPDFVCNLLIHILLHMGLQDEDSQMEFGALAQLDIPDYHSYSAQIMNLYSKIQSLVAAVDCPEAFMPKDLIKPEPGRTQIFLSALLNFHVFRDAKLNDLKPISDELEGLEERKVATQAKIAQLNAEIEECEALREQELPFIEEISFKVKEMNQKVTDLNKQQMKMKTSLKELKEKVKEMEEKNANAEFELVQSAQENASLRSKIVQSPDKLQRTLEEKKSVQIEAKNAERAALKSFQDKTATLEAYDKACRKMSKHLSQLQSLQEQVNQAKAVEKEVKVLKNKQSDDEFLDKSLEAKIVELQSKVDQFNEYKKQMEKEISLKNEESTKELNNVKLEVASKKQALESRQKQVEALVSEADAINSKKRTVKEDGEIKMQELCRKCEKIVAEFYNYSKKIGDLVPPMEPDTTKAVS